MGSRSHSGDRELKGDSLDEAIFFVWFSMAKIRSPLFDLLFLSSWISFDGA